MSQTECPHCGNDLTGGTGLGVEIHVQEAARYSAVVQVEDGTAYAHGYTQDAQLVGTVVRVLCGECREEVDAVPMLDDQAI